MFKQLRDLFKRTEPVEENLKLSFEELPAWLDAREEEIGRELSDAAKPPQEAIRSALDNLREIVARMKTTEGNEEVHPRLRDISKKALPQFTKSMTQILSRDPSGDPETFYATAAEILKGALRAVKGQGKYLSALYPDEMKEVRAAIRELGRGINTLTEAITRARTGQQQVEEVRRAYESLVRIREENVAVFAEIQKSREAIEGIGGKIRETEEGLAALKLRPDYTKKDEVEKKIRELKDLEDKIEREILTLRNPSLHVFSKAEKIARKTGNNAAATTINRVLDAYANRPSGDEENLVRLIEAAMPATLAMVRQGDLVLKNQDEIRLFSDPETLPAELSEVMQREREVREEDAALQEALAALPVVVEEQRLTSALTELQRERDAMRSALSRTEDQENAARASYAKERENLQSRAAALAGKEVEVDVPDLPSPSI
ncbi:hypothetical protein [Methanoculleus thermophilus]|uniref:Cell surface protein n=1 Tax=Methanoculleus thermophilus TaxID=2200 RepID=A0A1G9BNC6_9EURY|nr:hypothetical protein [Methanoculleus thermophilus]SDK40999.1 hypothetical protein SAMN04488571_11032 [Methanoculleus thermophilus]